MATLAALALLRAGAAFAVPDAITTLLVTPGETNGSIRLRWTARTDGASQPATRYIIKYRFNNTITNDTEWNNAYRIDEPPVNVSAPNPASPGVSESLLVTGLAPGTVYGFMVRAVDAAEVMSPTLTSDSRTATATSPCPRDPLDGMGIGSAAMVPTVITAGDVQMTTVTLSINGSGIALGGKIAMRTPDHFVWPTLVSANLPGHVSFSVTGGATLLAQVEGQTVTLTVSSGSINSSDTVKFYYRAQTCQLGEQRFRLSTQYQSCGVLSDTNLVANVIVTPGLARFVDFQTFDVATLIGTIVAVDLRAIDFCGNAAPLTAATLVPVSAVYFSGVNLVPATQAFVSLSSSPFNPQQNLTVSMATGATTARFYYRVQDTSKKPNDRIQLVQTDLQNPVGTWPRLATVRPLAGGVLSSSVDTGAFVAGQKNVTFTPDGDGVADVVAINFSLGEPLPWIVELSTINNFSNVIRRFYGDDKNVRLTWDGFADGQPGVPPSIAPSGSYYIRISLTGGSITDTSLATTLSAVGVQGLVQDESSIPLADVDVQIFGPTNRYARTGTAGTFVANGLKSGTYQIRYQKTGYGTVEFTANPTAGTLVLPTRTLNKESVLRLVVSRPQSDRMEEVWGQVRANNSDWTKQAWGTVHFGRGKDIADAGDLYNVEPTSHTALTLAPNVTYRIHFEVPNLSVPDFNQSLTANQDVFYPITLQPRANIEGTVQLAAGSNPNGTWISVEAGPDANLDLIYDNFDASKRFYGGAYLAPNEASGIYRIFGVDNGSYTVTASASNFIPAKATVVISNDQNGTVNFPTLSSGGTVTGSISVPGNSTALDSNDGTIDGFFNVAVNAWSSALQTGSFRQVRVATGTSGTLAVFVLTGLQNGVYEVYTNLTGYELTPSGRRSVTVTGGTGILSLAFQPFAGGLTGQITLPAAATDFNNAEITVRAYDWNLGEFSNPSISGSGTYTFSGLGTGFYMLRAKYATTGFVAEKNVQIVNGIIANADLDLSGDTFSISGRVSTSARSPYNTLEFLVNGSTPTTMTDTSDDSTDTLPANRVIAELIKRDNGGDRIDTDPSHYNSRTSFYTTYDTAGAFTFTNLTPGTYRIHNNDEIDNTFTNGPEVTKATRIIKVLTANATGQDIEITDGLSVSGSIRVSDGSIPARLVRLDLKNAAGAVVTSREVFLAAADTTFTLERVPSGDYVLSTTDDAQPKGYATKDVRVVVDRASVTSVVVDLLKASRIRGKLRLKTGTLLTSRNYDQFIPSDFFIEARSNPWFNGGFARASEPLIDADGNFTLYSSPGKFDVFFRSIAGLSPQDISQGKKQFVPLQISGIDVAAGQTYDLGFVELVEGSAVSGTVRNRQGQVVPNVLMVAFPSGGDNHREDGLQAVTSETGQYTLQGVDSADKRFYDVIAAPRDSDGRFSGFTGTRYGEVRRKQVDTRLSTPVDFVIEPANGIVRGRLVTPDGGEIETPFNHDEAGGQIIMNRVGSIPSQNPLGDIEESTLADGTFEIRGLIPGTYSLWGLAKGYANGLVRNILVGAGSTDVGDVPLIAGFKVKGKLTRPDGSAPSESEIDTLVAVRGGFEELLIGQLTKDAAGTITGYEISGFQAGKSYTVLVFDESDDILVLGEGIVVNSDMERDFMLVDRQPSVLAQATKASDGSVVVQFEFTRALRNSATDLDGLNGPDDSEGPKIISLTSGTGVVTYPIDWLSFDRKRARVVYAPAAGDSRFTLTVAAAFETVDPVTGQNNSLVKNFPFFLGIGKQKEQKFTNAGGGVVQLEEDTSEFSAQSGTFGTSADDTVDVLFRAADSADDFSTSNSAPSVSRAMGVAAKLGLKAYPSEMGGAINRARASAVTPFGSFYDIFLPLGVSHFFPEGKEARLCVAYDAGVADPYALNVYFFNTATDEFLLESDNKTVDTDNARICVSLSHASVFTVLASSASVISGAGYAGALEVINFPNPFDLKAKVVTLQNPGSAGASQTISGTMVKVSVPGDVAGALEIEIFSVSGERVRTIRDNIPAGGAHYYVPWDGTNDSGSKVASGAYVARMTIGGGNEKFFKMAVLK